ncbi:DUF536 domain-containing protein [Lactiplantibacillus plantarum]|uniref:DUF536 domain-containing protein n=1 Tax=Lactiplantibacillus plantarum TaxID=1590 RepID=UPI0021C607C3|nr:DUF536 domain-containing protein [Lactiplantibacillus plantarum]
MQIVTPRLNKKKRHQLTIKFLIIRRQLDKKDRQIEKLTQLLDQQQQLNLSTNRQNEKLLDTSTNNTPSQDDSPSQNDDTDVLKPTESDSKGKKLKHLKRAYSAG